MRQVKRIAQTRGCLGRGVGNANALLLGIVLQVPAQPVEVRLHAHSFNPFKYSRNGPPRSRRRRANSTVAFRNPSLSPASYLVPSKR